MIFVNSENGEKVKFLGPSWAGVKHLIGAQDHIFGYNSTRKLKRF